MRSTGSTDETAGGSLLGVIAPCITSYNDGFWYRKAGLANDDGIDVDATGEGAPDDTSLYLSLSSAEKEPKDVYRFVDGVLSKGSF